MFGDDLIDIFIMLQDFYFKKKYVLLGKIFPENIDYLLYILIILHSHYITF